MTLSYFGRTEIPPRRWLMWPFVVKLRERESSAMMAFEAAERGWGCILGNKFIGRRQDLPRGIVIEKLIAPGTASKISHMLEIGKRVSACCEEGLVYPNAQEYGRRKIERGSYDQLERFFAWGHIQANDLTERINLDGSKITISGNPRFDLHRPELRGAFDESVAAIRRRYGPFILINTRFSMFNSFRGDEAVVNKTQTLGKTADEGKTRDHIAFQGKIYSAFMDLVEALHDRLPELQIVIRPHPSERHDPWHAKAAEHARVHTISRCNVIPWILASDAVIHTNCTTGVEAYLLGKPAIAFRPICDPRFDMVLPNALSSESFDVEQTCDLIEATVCGKAGTKNAAQQAAVARRYIAAMDGPFAVQRIMDSLDHSDLPELPFSIVPSVGRDVYEGLGHWLQYERGAFARDRGRSQRVRDKVTGYRRGELSKLLGTMKRVTGRFTDVRIARIEAGLYCVYC